MLFNAFLKLLHFALKILFHCILCQNLLHFALIKYNSYNSENVNRKYENRSDLIPLTTPSFTIN